MIQPWQTSVLNKLQSIKPNQLVLTMAGRRTGKSQMNSQAFMRLWDDIHNRPVEELKLSEGTVYGSRYYCIEPVGGSWAKMELWCMQAFGETTGSIWAEEKAPDPAQRWYMNNRKFWFRDDADRLMFVLKWR
jgi:hypothetical protein